MKRFILEGTIEDIKKVKIAIGNGTLEFINMFYLVDFDDSDWGYLYVLDGIYFYRWFPSDEMDNEMEKIYNKFSKGGKEYVRCMVDTMKFLEVERNIHIYGLFENDIIVYSGITLYLVSKTNKYKIYYDKLLTEYNFSLIC